MAEFLAFLWIDGIKGESQDPRHIDEIDVLSYHFGAGQTGAPGGSPSKAQPEDFSIVKKLDKASPPLFLACAVGEHFPTAIFMLERSRGGRSAGELGRFVMRDGLVNSVRPGGSSGGEDAQPLEEVSFAFKTMTWSSTADNK